MLILVFDGVSGAGKSVLLNAFQNFLVKERSNYSKVFLCEHLTERYFENKTINKESVEKHVLKILSITKDIQSIQDESRFNKNQKILSIVIERLFLTFMSKDLLDIDFFQKHNEFIQSLDIKSVFLYIHSRYNT